MTIARIKGLRRQTVARLSASTTAIHRHQFILSDHSCRGRNSDTSTGIERREWAFLAAARRNLLCWTRHRRSAGMLPSSLFRTLALNALGNGKNDERDDAALNPDQQDRVRTPVPFAPFMHLFHWAIASKQARPDTRLKSPLLNGRNLNDAGAKWHCEAVCSLHFLEKGPF
jgi:hypothetical protein